MLLAGICVFFVFRNGKTETDRVLAKEKMPRGQTPAGLSSFL